MSKTKKELIVSAIENGTVIDHIPANVVFQVMRFLKLDQMKRPIFVGTNLDSKKFGKKGIIKVADKFFESEDINKIAIIAPKATLIVIKDFEVVYKKQVELPKSIKQFIKCVNPNCITNYENIETKFDVHFTEENEVKLHCHYCEKFTAQGNMTFL